MFIVFMVPDWVLKFRKLVESFQPTLLPSDSCPVPQMYSIRRTGSKLSLLFSQIMNHESNKKINVSMSLAAAMQNR